MKLRKTFVAALVLTLALTLTLMTGCSRAASGNPDPAPPTPTVPIAPTPDPLPTPEPEPDDENVNQAQNDNTNNAETVVDISTFIVDRATIHNIPVVHTRLPDWESDFVDDHISLEALLQHTTNWGSKMEISEPISIDAHRAIIRITNSYTTYLITRTVDTGVTNLAWNNEGHRFTEPVVLEWCVDNNTINRGFARLLLELIIAAEYYKLDDAFELRHFALWQQEFRRHLVLSRN